MVGGMLATILIFSGHLPFHYLRPFPPDRRRASVEGVSLILLGFGVANFIGTSIAGHLLSRSLPRLTLALVPLAMRRAGADDGDLRSYRAPRWIAGRHVGLRLRSGASRLVNWLATTVPDEAEARAGCWLPLFSWRSAPERPAAGGV